eukprot:TRINITY_DN1867_c0_g2_i2.p1 TRINITY_DN1867_c0_g2~~TRINITY_DN1867_c0_g2_i2.p1  ORF type:complete len:413 (+),score=36.02 TRINITY_DN1867_c0_g2_i2:170-1408(+)
MCSLLKNCYLYIQSCCLKPEVIGEDSNDQLLLPKSQKSEKQNEKEKVGRRYFAIPNPECIFQYFRRRVSPKQTKNSETGIPMVKQEGPVLDGIITPEASQQSSETTDTELVKEDEVSNRPEEDTEESTRPIPEVVSSPPLNFNIDLNSDLSPSLGSARLIGRGGFASVFKSNYCGFPVAIKLFRVGSVVTDVRNDVFERELSIISRLDHKNIVKFYGACYRPDRVIVMEYVEFNLYQVMERMRRTNKRFELGNIFKIIKSVASGLEYLHSKKIVHRDLHPQNILVSKDGYVKVADVGISKILSHSLTPDSNRGGVCNYLPPEIFEGRVHCKSDIYSLGIIACELWSLDQTWKNLREGLLFQKLQDEERPHIPDDMPQNLRKLITSCWHQDYQMRPTAQGVRQECEFELASLA